MQHENERGFTLIEIMVVVIIIGLLATLVGPRIWALLGKGQHDIAETKAKEYYDSVKLWRTLKKTKQIPSDLHEIEEPLEPGGDPFQRIELDPWGGEYYIEAEGNSFRIVSPGADGIDGTDDDIVYPPRDEE